MLSDKDLAKRLRRIFRDTGGDVARVDSFYARVRAEFAPRTPGYVPRYKPAIGRNAGLHNQMIERGLSLNANKNLNDGDRESLTGRKFDRSPRQVHRIFKKSTSPTPEE